MIITFATQKGGVGKTTLAIAFANYISLFKEKKVNVFDFDFQKSFFHKWKEDESTENTKLYEVEVVEDGEKPFSDWETINNMKESEDINIFDLAGTLDAKYSDLLIYSDFIVIPFEYSDVSAKSTLVFVNFLGMLESESDKIFIRSKYDKGFNYLNQQGMDEELKRFGKIIETPVFKRNVLQSINTRKLNFEQKLAVKNTFEEILTYINENTPQTTF